MTTICAVSDLHGFLPSVPESDILVVAGDISPLGFDQDVDRVRDWFESDFLAWIRSTPAKYRLFIAGNHDFAIQHYLADFQQYIDPEDLKFLHDNGVEIEGINFYGLPWVPRLKSWAFFASQEELYLKYNSVPLDTDVVISHGPPFGIADACAGIDRLTGLHPHVGTSAANRMIDYVKPKHFICGHIHEAYGHYRYDKSSEIECNIWSVSINDAFYDPVNKPVLFEV